MEYDQEVYLLSQQFVNAYPESSYPELMHKAGRPYSCLLVDSHCGYFICIPFRSSIRHKNAFLFTGSRRSLSSRSGLDYSKIVLISNLSFIDSSTKAIVDQDEYTEMIKNLPTIVRDATEYVETYINHMNGTHLIHPREFVRRYQYSTLPYFHSIMGIDQ
jgi:hypothetical protein